MEWIKDFGVFAWAVVNNWAGYCTGGVIVALLWLWSIIKQQSIPRYVAIGVALAFLLCAFFNAWRTEYRKTHPGFVLEFQQGYANAMSDRPGVFVFLQAVLYNRGLPSVADHWSLHIVPPSHAALDVTPVLTTSDMPIRYNSWQFSPNDSLYYKTTVTPIPSGGEVSGILVFLLPDKKLEEVGVAGTELTLSCRDAFGNKIKAQTSLRGGNTELQYFPGITPPQKVK
jgi:hypothetical protein